jgi:hypothetical protein
LHLSLINFVSAKDRRALSLLVEGLRSAPHPCRFYERKQSRQGWDNRILNRLLAELEVGVMMMVMVAVMNYHHNLRLRRIG